MPSRKPARLLGVACGLAALLASGAPVFAATYTVQSGDTLWTIANRFGISEQALAAANQLPNPNALSLGQRLTIPNSSGGGSSASASGSSGSTYVVQSGDTLWTVASRFGISVSALEQANGMNNQSLLHIGQTLAIPGGGSSGSSGSSSTSSGSTYVVQSGDTLWTIASRFGISVASLEQANGMNNQSLLHIGETLTIPGGGGGGSSTGSAPASGGSTYVVQSGDTPSSIAAKFGISLSALLQANPSLNATDMQIGQTLTIPGGGGGGSSTASALTPSGSTYLVQSGDTLSTIASRFGISVASLEQANGMSGQTVLQIGQSLIIPQANGGATTASYQAAIAPVSLSSRGGTYVVSAGDTLSGIASRFGISVSALQQANGITAATSLQIGQRLVIPTNAVPTSLSVGNAIVQTAMQYVNVSPYVFGGTTPAGFDCSGYTQYVYGRNGISLPRTSQSQVQVGTPVAESALVPGDLVFFSVYSYADHVGIYIGNGQFVAAPAPGQYVSQFPLNSPYWQSHYLAARQPF